MYLVKVALLAEGVDRNRFAPRVVVVLAVALLAEGVDRNNNIRKILAMLDKVALLAEGVDRNNNIRKILAMLDKSPSSRRAWIEIAKRLLRMTSRWKSPSSRRAWIEIFLRMACSPRFAVALLAEGVDRNLPQRLDRRLSSCRPPRGGRG